MPAKADREKEFYRIRDALKRTGGNITRAAALLKVSKVWCMSLVKRHELNGWARDLRRKSDLPVTGRPRKVPEPLKPASAASVKPDATLAKAAPAA